MLQVILFFIPVLVLMEVLQRKKKSRTGEVVDEAVVKVDDESWHTAATFSFSKNDNFYDNATRRFTTNFVGFDSQSIPMITLASLLQILLHNFIVYDV